MTSNKNSVLYIGVTNDLKRRLKEHKEGINPDFTSKYIVHKLVYFERFPEIIKAIDREKQLKNWRREWKNELVDSSNPDWVDISDTIL